MKPKIGIDVSRYRKTLVKSQLSGHVTWISAKAVEVDDQIYNGWNARNSVDLFVDESFSTHCQTAYDLGVPFVPYIFVNPIYKSEWYASSYVDHVKHPNNLDPEILALRQALKNKSYQALAIDCERWWRRYNQYYAAIKDKSLAVERVASIWIRDSIADLHTRIREEMDIGNFRDVPIWFYFGKWFVDGYSPELDTFFKDKLQWVTKYNGPVYDASLKTSAARPGSWEQLEAIVEATTFTAPWVGNRPADAFQLTDKFFLPGIYDGDGKTPLSVDINVTVSDWAALFAGSVPNPTPNPIPVPTPEPTPTPDLAALTARVSELEIVVSKLTTVTQAVAAWAKVDRSLK